MKIEPEEYIILSPGLYSYDRSRLCHDFSLRGGFREGWIGWLATPSLSQLVQFVVRQYNMSNFDIYNKLNLVTIQRF